MPTKIRIWALESEHDKKAVEKLAQKLIRLSHSNSDVQIMASGQKAYADVITKRKDSGLKIAVDAYLKEVDKVIFVIDADNPAAIAKHRTEQKSYITRIQNIMPIFPGKVFLAMMIQELEAWLLVDCVGIGCYFAKNRYSPDNCRHSISQHPKLSRVIKSYQKGNTEHILEAESGGKGVKEYLESFSEAILKTLNPKMPLKNVSQNRYTERMSPEIVAHLEISDETIRRNPSLGYFFDLLKPL